MKDEKTKSSADPAPRTIHTPDAVPSQGSNGRPSTLTAAGPAKKFPRADDAPAKRGPGRPPKFARRGGADSPAETASRVADSPAADQVRSTPAAPPADATSGLGVRGLLQMAAGISAGISWVALKIPYVAALNVWQFSESELKQLETPCALFLDKYGPALDAYGMELQFAGAVLPVLTAKIFAIISLKRSLDAKHPKVTEIRPPAAQPAAPQPESRREPDPRATPENSPQTSETVSPGESLPSAFLHHDVDRAAELVSLG